MICISILNEYKLKMFGDTVSTSQKTHILFCTRKGASFLWSAHSYVQNDRFTLKTKETLQCKVSFVSYFKIYGMVSILVYKMPLDADFAHPTSGADGMEITAVIVSLFTDIIPEPGRGAPETVVGID